MSDPMSLTVLGCSGSYPGPGGACSGYLVRGGGVAVVLDMGPGTLANLQLHMAMTDIDAVFISHTHADHWTDLAGLRTALKYGLGVEGLAVYSTGETREAAEALCVNLEPTFDWNIVTDGDAFEVGGLRFVCSRTEHYVETLAVRVDELATGTSIAYSADTGTGWSLEALGDGLDLALVESTYPTDAEAQGVLHLSAAQAGAMARVAGARNLVLTHLWPPSDPELHEVNATAAFGCPVQVASVGATYRPAELR